MKTGLIYIVVGLLALASFAVAVQPKDDESAKQKQVEKSVTKAKRQIKTVYGINGRVVNQAQDAKGWHRVGGIVTLSSGVDTVTLNTSLLGGKNDISFIADSTYGGRAWSLNQGNANAYRVIPLSGTKFLIKSSDGADTATVRFMVEGE